MSRKCPITGKKTISGKKYSRRGKAKYLGGVGIKVTSKTNRKFKPNMKRIQAVVDGKVVRINVSAKAISDGLVTKPLKRNYKPEAAE